MSCEKENKGTLSALNMYIEISIYVLIVCHVMCIQANAQYTERNNIKSIKIHRNDYFNPGSSGDVNPEISNRGIILINHFKPTDSWSTYEFNLSKYISIDTLDKLIEKVGTNENDETVCVHRITRDTIYCHDYGSFPEKSSMYSTNLKSDLKKREIQYKLEDRVIFMDKKKKLYVYESEKLMELNKKYIKEMMNEEF